jgi:hypothetical protein
LEKQLIITAESALVGETTAQVRAGRNRVGKGNVGFRQTQVVLEHVRMRLHQALQQVNADLGVAMLQQHGRSHHVQGTEQARGRPIAEIRIDFPASAGTAFDLRDQIRGAETFLLHQAACHRSLREHGGSSVFVVLPHDIVRIFAIGGRILPSSDQGFERVRQRQRVLVVGRHHEFGMNGAPAAGAPRAQAEKRGNQQQRPAVEATARGHLAAVYSP